MKDNVPSSSQATVESMDVDSQEDQVDVPDQMTSKDMVSILNRLETMDTPELQALHEKMKGCKVKMSKTKLKNTLKVSVVFELTKGLTPHDMRHILQNFPAVKVHKNNDKLPGQIRNLANKDDKVLSAVKNFLCPQSSSQDEQPTSKDPGPEAMATKTSSDEPRQQEKDRGPSGDQQETRRQRGQSSKTRKQNTRDNEETGIRGQSRGRERKPQDRTPKSQPPKTFAANTPSEETGQQEKETGPSGDQHETRRQRGHSSKTRKQNTRDNEETRDHTDMRGRQERDTEKENDGQQNDETDREERDKERDKSATKKTRKRRKAADETGQRQERQEGAAVPMTVGEMISVLQNLDTMDRTDMIKHLKRVAGYSQGGTPFEEQNSQWIRSSLRSHVVGDIIGSLTIEQQRTILRDICNVQPYKHYSKLLGQLKQQALNNPEVLTAVMEVRFAGDPQERPLETPKDLLDTLSKVNTFARAELEDIYFRLANQQFDKKKEQQRLMKVTTRALYRELVSCLNQPDILYLLSIYDTHWNNPGPDKTKLVSLLMKDANPQRLKENLQRRQAEEEAIKVEELLNMNTEIAMWNEMDEDELRSWHKRLGSKATGRTPRAEMIRFCRRAIAERLVDVLPARDWRKVLKCHKVHVSKTRSVRAALIKKVMEDFDIKWTLHEAVDRILEGKVLDDLSPLNKWKLEERQEKLKRIRIARLQQQDQGTFRLIPDGLETPVNPIIESAKEVEANLLAYQLVTCDICREAKPTTDVTRKRCDRCTNEKPTDGKPYKFSPENNMFPGQAPEVLRNLSTVEQCAIAPVSCLMKIVLLRGGGSKLKGSAISFPQDVNTFARTLPHRPEHLPLIIIKMPHQQHVLEANSNKMRAALIWLKQHNIHFKDIEISEENLNLYPDDNSPVEGLRIIEPSTTDENNQDQDQQEQQGQEEEEYDDHHGVENPDAELVGSVVNQQVPVESTDERIRSALEGHTTQDQGPQPIPEVNWPTRGERPISEFKTEGFLTMCYPHLFPTGEGDISMPRRGDTPKLLDYVDHLLWLDTDEGRQNRFAADPRFVFHMVNMEQRHKALMLGHVFADRACSGMSLDQVRKVFTDKTHPLYRCLTMMSGQIPGTSAYFSSMRRKAMAFEKFIRISTKNEERFNLFLTFSLPDNHMHQLHRLLPGSERYLNKTVVDVIPEGQEDSGEFITKKDDYLLRQKALNANGHIVDWFAHKRMKLMVDKILEDQLGTMDYIIRCEYQSRSAIHFHMVARCVGISLKSLEFAFANQIEVENMKVGAKEFTNEEDMQKEVKKLQDMGRILVTPENREQIARETEDHQKKVLKFGALAMGISACHPDQDVRNWPPPIGTNDLPPPTNALRTTVSDVANDPNQDLDTDYTHIFNRTMLHKCKPGYCYNASLPKENQLCRFHYPFDLIGYKLEYGESEVPTLIRRPNTEADPVDMGMILGGDLLYLRNHPKAVECIPELLSFWRGNVDMKVIKKTDILIRYIMKYVLKPESNSMTFNDISRHIADNTDDETATTKKVLQKILLSLVKEHDKSKNEAFKVISGRDYVFFSREFNFVNMTDKRRLNLEALKGGDPTANALTENFADKYWTRDDDPNYLEARKMYQENPNCGPQDPKDVSLYQYASVYSKRWIYTGECKVPVITPQFLFIPNKGKKIDAYKSYCEVTLQLHKPGSNPTNILWRDNTDPNSEKFESAEEALKDFVMDNSSPCPDVVREEFIAALAMQSDEDEQMLEQDIEDLLASPLDNDVEQAAEDLIPGLTRPVQTVIDHEEMDEQIQAAEAVETDYQNLNLQMTLDHDWSTDRRELNMTNETINLAAGWIKDMKNQTTIDGQAQSVHIDINTLNREQRWVYRTAVEAMDNPNQQKLIDVCGGAGTGKSYTINATLQYARENGYRVQVMAPTGAAASQFVGGKTIHTCLKLPVSKKKKEKQNEDFEELGPAQAQALESDLEDVRLIIIDEKSMMGKNRLAQIDSRLKQARPQCRDKPFGGISIMIAGDFKQLPPVFDPPLYKTDEEKTAFESTGRILYRLFDENTFHLEAQMRQAGAANRHFREELMNLGLAQFTQDNYNRWRGFMDLTQMADDRRKEFEDEATMLVAVKKDLAEWNERGLLNLERPIASSSARNNCAEAKAANVDDAGGLYNQLFFAKGSKVILTNNFWCEAGLVNGSQGTVEYIIYKEGSDPVAEDTMPDLLLVNFPGYLGPSYLTQEANIVPIVPWETDWLVRDKNGGMRRLTRQQFPLIYGYALTIHKAQGTTHHHLLFNVNHLFHL